MTEEALEGIDEIKKEALELKSKIDLKAQSSDIDEIIETFSNKYNVDSDFIKAIIKQESGFNPKATSKKGAMGLMQLMPSTAKSLGVNNAYNPWENIEGGVKYLKGLLDKYNNNHELALAAYNAGSGAVKKYGGVPPYKETQNYVKSIMSAYSKVKEAKI
ncbi:lytic transglycosylase domain-containing protein [bacterium]|nr:lytic transglycosylase domain-containing protein [bacterium]